MLEPTSSRFWQAALQSGLADSAALQACWDAIPDEKRTPEHIDRRLARAAVQANVLTLWQAQQLVAGRSTGFKVDRYVLIDLIGQGGMGRVYLARDSRLNRRVALKILSPERVNNPRAIARFHREALVGAQLQHEHLVRIYDEGEANGKCYLVMEYIEGKNIGQMIAEHGPIPSAVAARLGRQVALGLEHAQRKGLIHRDVNPYNILVTRDGIAKLTDLGLAIDLSDQDRVTRDGATVGTFDYVSPEQARHSHSVDTRSDIYSLGCTLYHMLTGQVPFPSASLPEKLFGHQATEPEPIRKLAPEVPEGLEAVVVRMMRKSPDDRYATPLELAQALEPLADSGASTTVSDAGGSSRSGIRHAVTVTQESTPLSNTIAAPIEPPAPPAPPPPALLKEVLGTPSSVDSGLLGLGIVLDPEPQRSSAPAPSPAPAARPRTKVEAPPTPAPAEPLTPAANDEGLFGLGIVLDSEPSRPRAPAPPPTPAARPKTKVEAPPAPPPPEPVPPAANDEGLFGLGIVLDAEPSRPRAPAPPPAPAARPTPRPKPKVEAPPAPAPVVVETANEPDPGLPTANDEGLLGLGIAVNLGPEPSLSQGQSTTRSLPRPKPKTSPAPTSKPKPKPRTGQAGRPPWIVPAAAAAGLLVVLAGAVLAYRALSGGGAAASSAVEVKPKKSPRIVAAPGASKANPPEEIETPRGKQVLVVEGDGTRRIEPDFVSAVRTAIGSRGYILLQNDTPLKLSSKEKARASGRQLVIKAAEGTRPVLEVEIKGNTPFLTTSTGSPLRIEGVTIIARYTDPGTSPAPVIEAGTSVELDRCAFRVEGKGPAGARAVALEGGKLTASGCWFENFDRALDIAYFGGDVSTIRHCMFVRTRGDEPTGWALRLRSMPGGFAKTGRRLVLDHCTVRGQGFLDVTGFSAEAPMKVEPTACAVLAEALVVWSPADKPPTREALLWSGHDNLYDIHGQSWVQLAPDKPWPEGPTDLKTWSAKLGDEADPVAPPLKFATEPASLSEHPEPHDFAVASQGAQIPGANPALVGPGADPLPKSATMRR